IDPAPFSRLGWFGNLEGWVQSKVPAIRTEATELLQLNGSETFSLLRLGTPAQRLWFKAVGKPNLHEFPITLLLSQLFPDYLPKLIASDPLLNGWLMESGGVTLGEFGDLNVLRNAVQRLARLQIESIPWMSKLRSAGCSDLSCPALAALVVRFFDVMGEVME